MRSFISCLLASLVAATVFLGNGAAAATPAASASATDCTSKAVGKDGKPLAGAAKTSFIKKCEADAKGSSGCGDKAVDKNGKPLAGAAKTSFMKKCEADAKTSK
jgi:hypothetical protein